MVDLYDKSHVWLMCMIRVMYVSGKQCLFDPCVFVDFSIALEAI